jgi:hypothetical protein
MEIQYKVQMQMQSGVSKEPVYNSAELTFARSIWLFPFTCTSLFAHQGFGHLE